MDFFDCNVYYGLPAQPAQMPVASVDELVGELARNAITKALVWHRVQVDSSAPVGNQMLAHDIQPHANLTGCWAIYPNQAHEFPPPEEFLLQMRANRIRALRAFPISHHFLFNRVSMGSWLGMMLTYRIPLFLSVVHGCSWPIIYDLLKECPELRLVICDHGSWGEDRYFRPLFEQYPNVYIDTSRYLLDGGIEAIVRSYGPGRILFGSGFPDSYFAPLALTLKHAEISEDAKHAIASRNLEHLLAEVAL